jgi:hypothetical protein
MMARYVDGYNLYYAGLRVDGYAVIKKKIGGRYFTLAYKPVFTESGKYDRDKNPNLLPLGTSIGLKAEARNIGDSSVSLKLYADIGRKGNWTLVAEAIDDGRSYGGSAHTGAAYAGIRTDFMDVEFDDYLIEALLPATASGSAASATQ